jgi:hypothetical protein
MRWRRPGERVTETYAASKPRRRRGPFRWPAPASIPTLETVSFLGTEGAVTLGSAAEVTTRAIGTRDVTLTVFDRVRNFHGPRG